jgi:hypothetical protein
MRDDSYSVKDFNFSQFGSFVHLIHQSSPQDLHVFRKYADAAIIHHVFEDTDLKAYFESFIDLMHLFALNGDFAEGASSYKLLLMVNEAMSSEAIMEKPIHDRLINIIWFMVLRESSVAKDQRSRSSNPLIPRLLELLYTYKRDAALTKHEYLQLYQINNWIENQCNDGKLPEEYK